MQCRLPSPNTPHHTTSHHITRAHTHTHTHTHTRDIQHDYQSHPWELACPFRQHPSLLSCGHLPPWATSPFTNAPLQSWKEYEARLPASPSRILHTEGHCSAQYWRHVSLDEGHDTGHRLAALWPHLSVSTIRCASCCFSSPYNMTRVDTEFSCCKRNKSFLNPTSILLHLKV
jgi:hypothetical protein